MAEERINSIVAPEAEKQLDSIKVKLRETADELSSLQKIANTVELKLGDTTSIVELNKLLKELGQNTGEVSRLTKEQINLKKQEEQLEQQQLRTKQQSLKVQQEEERAKQQILKTDDAINKARTKEEKQVKDLTNDYALLSKAYNEAALRAKNYALQLGANHQSTITAVNDAKALGDKLKSLDAVVGQYQRNVGNYNMVGAQFNQLLRELPNLAQSPQIFIMSLSNNMSYFAEAIQRARKEGQSWGNVLGTIASSTFGLIGIINIAVLAVSTFGERIVNFFSESAMRARQLAYETLGLTSALEKLAQQYEFLNYHTDRTATLETAKLRAAGAERDKIIQAEIAGNKERIENNNLYRKNLIEEIGALDSYLSRMSKKKSLNEKETKAFEKALKDREDAQNKYNTASEELGKLSTKNEVLELEKQEFYREKADREREKAVQARKKEQERLAALALKGDEAEFETLKNKLTKQSEAQEAIANNEENTLTERLEGVQGYYELQAALINANADFEIKKAKGNEREIKAINERRADDLIFLSQKVYDFDIKVTKQVADKRKKELEEYNKALQKSIDVNNKSAQAARDREAKAWQQFYNKLYDMASNAVNQIFEAFANAQNIRSESEIERLEDEKEREDRNLRATLARIEASTAAGVDKEKAIQEAHAQSDAKMKDIERRQSEERRKAAQAEKDAAVLQAIANVAVGVARAFKDYKYPVSLAIAGATAAAGAIQIATIRNTPLPAYAEGTLDHVGGKFIAGDGGEKELVVEPTGRTYWSKDIPTLYNAPAGTKVLNQDMINQLAYGLGQPIKHHVNSDKKLFEKIEKAIEQGSKRTVSAIRQNRAMLNVQVVAPSVRYNKLIKGKA